LKNKRCTYFFTGIFSKTAFLGSIQMICGKIIFSGIIKARNLLSDITAYYLVLPNGVFLLSDIIKRLKLLSILSNLHPTDISDLTKKCRKTHLCAFSGF